MTRTLHWRTTPRAASPVWLLAAATAIIVTLVTWKAAADVGFYLPEEGRDLDLYLGAAQRWLAGGGYYLPWQLAGPYAVSAPPSPQPILYPPPSLVLFVPFTVLPRALWYALPLAIVAWRVVALRPSWAAWLVIGGLAVWPWTITNLWAGNPGVWVAAAVALATRWPAFGPLVLLKYTLAPLALMGIRHRSWWAGLAVLALVSLAFLPMWPDYVRAIVNAQTQAPFAYSVLTAGLPLIPVVAWLGRSRQKPGIVSAEL